MFKKNARGQSILEWPMQSNNKRVFTCGRVLGKGGFGKCYELIQNESGNRFACKIIDKQSQQYKSTKQKVQSEISIHGKMKHQNIVKFERYHEDEQFIYILLQLCNNNTLDEVLHRRKQLTQVQVRYYFHQILEGVRYIHQQRIIHRDLKLQNFFISDQMIIKIGDFGLASSLTINRRRKSICGTPNYMAPQIFSNQDGYSYEIDVWSLGVIAFLLLAGRFPFEKSDIQSISSQLKSKNYFQRTNLSQNCKSFISKMLQLNPSERSPIKQLLKHDFFLCFDIPESIPLSCLICEPTFSFVKRYKQARIDKDTQDDDKFHFMLQSKQSPNNQQKSIELNYQKIDSITHINEPIKKICSFGYQSKRNDSCHINKWIVQYWQYPRYGLLYKTSDGLFGVRFNDGSNFKLFDHFQNRFTYITANGKVICIDKQKDEFQESLRMKLRIFCKLLQGKAIDQCCESGEIIYVRLYYNSLHAFVIWLSNGMLQSRFQDGSQLIMSIDSCMHIDQRKIKTIFPSKEIGQQPLLIKQKMKTIEAFMKRIKAIKISNKENNAQLSRKVSVKASF